MTTERQRKITEVRRIIELTGTETVNDYLMTIGWILLDTFKIGVPGDSGLSQQIYYALGWTEED